MTTITGRPPKLTRTQQDRLLFLYSIGTPKAVIAAAFGISVRVVTAYIRGEHKNPGLQHEASQ